MSQTLVGLPVAMADQSALPLSVVVVVLALLVCNGCGLVDANVSYPVQRRPNALWGSCMPAELGARGRNSPNHAKTGKITQRRHGTLRQSQEQRVHEGVCNATRCIENTRYRNPANSCNRCILNSYRIAMGCAPLGAMVRV